MGSPGFERLREAVLDEIFKAERQRHISMSARMQVEHRAALCSEIHDGVSLQYF